MDSSTPKQLHDLLRPGLYEQTGRLHLEGKSTYCHFDMMATDMGVEIVLMAPVKRTTLTLAEWNAAQADKTYGELFRSKINELSGD